MAGIYERSTSRDLPQADTCVPSRTSEHLVRCLTVGDPLPTMGDSRTADDSPDIMLGVAMGNGR